LRGCIDSRLDKHPIQFGQMFETEPMA